MKNLILTIIIAVFAYSGVDALTLKPGTTCEEALVIVSDAYINEATENAKLKRKVKRLKRKIKVLKKEK